MQERDSRARRPGARRRPSRRRTRPSRGLPLRIIQGMAFLAGALVTVEARSTTINEPVPGSFVDATEVRVTGAIPTSAFTATTASLNGAPLLLVEGDGQALFDVLVTLDTDRVFNPLLLEWSEPGDGTGRERVTVVAGGFELDGEASRESAALHFTQTGLDAFEPALDGLVGFDLDSLLPVGRRIYSKCLVDTFAGCLGRAKVYVDDPPPSFESQRVSLEARAEGVRLDLVLSDVRIDLDIRGSGVVPDCRLRLTADAARIGGTYAMGPDAALPTRLDLSEAGPLDLAFASFRQNFTGGACNDGLIEDVVDDIVGDLRKDIRKALRDLLEDPDGGGPGDGPLSESIEDALAQVEITAPIAEALDVDLRSPIARVDHLEASVTLVTHTAVQARVVGFTGEGGCDAPVGAPDFVASHEPDATVPALGTVTPLGLVPFDVALALSDAALNQGLKALTECGLLHSDLEELELAGNKFPITAQLLAIIEPAFRALPPSLPLVIRVRPSLAPILGAGAGPFGELAALRIADLRVDIVDPMDDTAWLELSVDAITGLDIGFDLESTQLVLGTAGALSDVEVVVLGNAISAEEAALIDRLGGLLEDGTVSLSDDLGGFRLPGFLGLELVPIEIARDPSSATFFFEAVPTPEPSTGVLGGAALLALAGLARSRSPQRRVR